MTDFEITGSLRLADNNMQLCRAMWRLLRSLLLLEPMHSCVLQFVLYKSRFVFQQLQQKAHSCQALFYTCGGPLSMRSVCRLDQDADPEHLYVNSKCVLVCLPPQRSSLPVSFAKTVPSGVCCYPWPCIQLMLFIQLTIYVLAAVDWLWNNQDGPHNVICYGQQDSRLLNILNMLLLLKSCSH